jgi:putative PIN family toxin of toxin-antitoxin system
MSILQRRKFQLTVEERRELLGDYLPYCEIVEVVRKCSVVCRDPKDQSFLDLAHSGKADSLVSGDRDLLVLAGKTKFLIETPEEYRRRAERN